MPVAQPTITKQFHYMIVEGTTLLKHGYADTEATRFTDILAAMRLLVPGPLERKFSLKDRAEAIRARGQHPTVATQDVVEMYQDFGFQIHLSIIEHSDTVLQPPKPLSTTLHSLIWHTADGRVFADHLPNQAALRAHLLHRYEIARSLFPYAPTTDNIARESLAVIAERLGAMLGAKISITRAEFDPTDGAYWARI